MALSPFSFKLIPKRGTQTHPGGRPWVAADGRGDPPNGCFGYAANDKKQLVLTVAAIPEGVGRVEAVFGIIKSGMGFRRFLLRGLEKVSTENRPGRFSM
jgi:hypothetical protein